MAASTRVCSRPERSTAAACSGGPTAAPIPGTGLKTGRMGTASMLGSMAGITRGAGREEGCTEGESLCGLMEGPIRVSIGMIGNMGVESWLMEERLLGGYGVRASL
jgi:hypothetical protein